MLIVLLTTYWQQSGFEAQWKLETHFDMTDRPIPRRVPPLYLSADVARGHGMWCDHSAVLSLPM
ncbi:hypothetical protein [Candidatus Erwinia dacicola]|uniref:Uncharacterized protein n=1 Tax=Candidatus Erwinia dacicola TaxID=252393 RepID=A0A328TTC0_9GAMM|nr:hypothetical protein [Candidatus Erwinia dacicola]NJC99632.1 hypothetical protein [Candidatus Erwinia dacicola]RAP71066.1 hypothetical protein ACZ87_02129 [Candidatus Erwinia dacicola]